MHSIVFIHKYKPTSQIRHQIQAPEDLRMGRRACVRVFLLGGLKVEVCAILCLYLTEFFFSVQELCDSADEFWIHEQRFTVTERRQRKRQLVFQFVVIYSYCVFCSSACSNPPHGPTDSHRAFRTSHFSLKYFQARFLPWGFLPTWMMTSMTSCSGTRSEVRDRFSNLGDTDTELTDCGRSN